MKTELKPPSRAVALGDGLTPPRRAVPRASLDTRSGAPVRLRLMVASTPRPEDKLATLRQYYPDAQVYGDGNFVYTDPDTGRATLFDEQQSPGWIPTIGDVADVAPETGEFFGAAGGATIGSGLGPGGTVAGAGIGAPAGRQVVEQGLQYLLDPVVDTRDVSDYATDTAASAIVNMAGEGVGGLVQRGAQRLAGVTPEVAQRMAAAERLGAGDKLTVGTATGNRGAQGLENAGLRSTISGASVFQNQDQAILTRLSQARTAAARDASGGRTPLDAEDAGRVIKEGAQGYAKRFARRRQAFADDLETVIGGDTPVAVTNVEGTLADFVSRMSGAERSLAGRYGKAMKVAKKLLDDAADNGGSVPFQALREARTTLGDNLARPDISGYAGGEQAALRSLYGALKADIYAAAAATGPQASRILRRHDTLVRNARAKDRPVNMHHLNRVVETNSDVKAYQWALSGSQHSGERLRALRGFLEKDEWDLVAGSVIEDLGRPTAGATNQTGFSFNTFMTAWNKMSDSGKKALFGGTRYEGARRQLDDLAEVSQTLKESGAQSNFSGTGRANWLQTLMLSGVMGAPFGANMGQMVQGAVVAGGALEGTAWAMSKLMTSQKFVKWLTDTSYLASKAPNTLPKQMSRLLAIGVAEPELRDYIYAYNSQLERQLPALNSQPSEPQSGATDTPPRRREPPSTPPP